MGTFLSLPPPLETKKQVKKSIPIELTHKEEMKMQGKLTVGIPIMVVSALLSCASYQNPPAGGSNPSATKERSPFNSSMSSL